jgi:hypothetical protein
MYSLLILREVETSISDQFTGKRRRERPTAKVQSIMSIRLQKVNVPTLD